MHVSIITKHLSRQLILAILGLTVVLSFITWLTQSLKFLELIANNGITPFRFMQIIALLLPSLTVVILPICCLVATVFIIHKLIGENEIVIYQAGGISLVQIIRPFLIVGFILASFSWWLANSVAPKSTDKFSALKNTLSHEFSAGVIRDGTFSKFKDLTIYVQDRLDGDKLHNVFLYRKEANNTEMSIFAENGQVIASNGRIYLQLFNGCRQVHSQNLEDNKAFFFKEFLYDLNILSQEGVASISGVPFSMSQLLRPSMDIPDSSRSKMMIEAHKRIIGSFLVFLFVLHGAALLLTSPYKRGGNNKIALLAVTSGILLQIVLYVLINLLSKSLFSLFIAYLILISLTGLHCTSLIQERNILTYFRKK